MKIVKKIDLIVLKAFVGPFMATFALSMFLFLVHFLWKYIDDLVGKGIETPILLELIAYSMIPLVVMALPLTIMVAGLMTMGNLSENFSLVALKSSGISLLRILRPLMIFMGFLSIGNFYFMNVIMPKAQLESLALLWDVRQKKPALNITEGIFYKEIHKVIIRLGKKDKDNETVHDVLIYMHKEHDDLLPSVLRAKNGVMKLSADKRSIVFDLKDGSRYDEMTENNEYNQKKQFNLMHFERQVVTIDISSLDLKFTEREAYKNDHSMMNLNQLQAEIDSIKKEQKNRNINNRSFISRFVHLESFGPSNYRNREYNKIEDSALKALTPVEIISQFDVKDRNQIYQFALGNARSLKGTMEGVISNIDLNREEIAPYKVDWHKKFTLISICILLFLIAAPLGAIIRKGGIGLPLVISVIMFVLFYAINLVGEKLGESGTLPVWVGMWLSSFVLLPIGLWILYKAINDSSAFTLEKYISKFVKWIIAKFKKNKANPIA